MMHGLVFEEVFAALTSLQLWLKRFNGIASRYLVNYSGWQRFLDDGELRTPAQLLTAIIQCAICRRKVTN